MKMSGEQCYLFSALSTQHNIDLLSAITVSIQLIGIVYSKIRHNQGFLEEENYSERLLHHILDNDTLM